MSQQGPGNFQTEPSVKISTAKLLIILAFFVGLGIPVYISNALINNGFYFCKKAGTTIPIDSAKPTSQTTVSPSADPGNSLSEALDIGNLKGTRTYNEFVGSVDLEDYYRFQLDTTSNLQLDLSGLSAYTYVELILDRNGNGSIDSGEVLNRDSGSSSASIRTPLGAGTYAIRVYLNAANYNTTYTLQVSAEPVGTN
jgi:hypothetical protein